jgi:AcrR family transcriptional regulator
VPVTKDLLFQRALAIIDTEGLTALTMRRLAADVGVEAASLYHHVPNKQAVLDGAVSVMRAAMVFDQPLPTHWREIMELIFLRYLDLLTAHPNMLPLAARHVESDPAEGLLFLLDAGLAQDDAAAVWQSIIAFVLGYATFASQALIADVDHLPAGLATRVRRWDRRTAQHALRAPLGAYDITPPRHQPKSATRPRYASSATAWSASSTAA